MMQEEKDKKGEKMRLKLFDRICLKIDIAMLAWATRINRVTIKTHNGKTSIYWNRRKVEGLKSYSFNKTESGTILNLQVYVTGKIKLIDINDIPN